MSSGFTEDDHIGQLRMFLACPDSSERDADKRTGQAPDAGATFRERIPPKTGVVNGPLIAT